MAFTYQKQYNNGGGFGRAPYSNNNGFRGNTQGFKKHSGCKQGVNGTKPWVRGWNFSRRSGMVSVVCGPWHNEKTGKGTKECVSKKGRISYNWVATVQVGKQAPYQTSCFYYPDTHKVNIPALGMVMNPNAPNGGYFGTFKKK